jgi:hypothetical protein
MNFALQLFVTATGVIFSIIIISSLLVKIFSLKKGAKQ